MMGLTQEFVKAKQYADMAIFLASALKYRGQEATCRYAVQVHVQVRGAMSIRHKLSIDKSIKSMSVTIVLLKINAFLAYQNIEQLFNFDSI